MAFIKPLKIGYSGLRGIVGETFTTELAVQFAQSFGTYVEGGKVLVGRDTRKSGPMIQSAVMAGLLSCGCEVVDLGVCPTPALQLMTKNTDAIGGISISAGHNPENWNALKFIRSDGVFLQDYQAEELLDIFHQGEFQKADWKGIKKVQIENKAKENHITEILKGAQSIISEGSFQNKKFKAALDCCNGACWDSAPELLTKLGCEIVVLNNMPDQPHPREPEPKPENMVALCAVMKASKCDIGFALDSEGGRLALVTENAEALSEEYTFLLCALGALKETAGVIVTSLSTTCAIEDVAQIFGGRVVRTKVSPSAVAQEAIQKNAILGGEGSGGVLFPKLHYAYDAQAAMVYMLKLLAKEGIPLSLLAKEIPPYKRMRKSFQCPAEKIHFVLERAGEELLSEWKDAEHSFLDGVKFSWEGKWAHLRASNTEPVIRLHVEAKQENDALKLFHAAEKKILTYLPS